MWKILFLCYLILSLRSGHPGKIIQRRQKATVNEVSKKSRLTTNDFKLQRSLCFHKPLNNGIHERILLLSKKILRHFMFAQNHQVVPQHFW